MNKRVTITEIAKLTNTSKTTVSRVLTGKGYVSKPVALRIQQAAKQLGYVPQHKSATNIQDMVMVLSCQLESEAQVILSNAIRKRLFTFGIKTVIAPIDFGSDAIYDYLDYAQSKKFGGIISLGALYTPRLCRSLQNCACPIVLLNQSIPDLDAAHVSMDDYRGAYQATTYLLEHGHTHITFLTGYASATAIQDRERGFYDAMSDHGILYNDISIIYTDFTQASSEAFVNEQITHGGSMTAVFCSTDVIAKGILHACAQHNIRIPEDISVIAFGNNVDTYLHNPPISVIDYDFDAMGNAMADLLLEKKGYIHPATIQTDFEPTLIIRDSIKPLGS